MKAKHNYMTPDSFEYVDMESEVEEVQMSLTEDEAVDLGIEWEAAWGDTLFFVLCREINEFRKPMSDLEISKVLNSFEEPVVLGLITSLIVEDYVNDLMGDK